MTTVKVIDLPVDGAEFQAILSEHGNGEIQPRFDYAECREESYPEHKIIRGIREDNTVTGTGFLHLPIEPNGNPSPADVIANAR